MNFSDFSLHPILSKAISDRGFTTPTPIQEAVIPIAMKGNDIAGIAQTGTGKTAAFLIPLMHRILNSAVDTSQMSEEDATSIKESSFPDWKKRNFILILVPTRELAEQIYEEFNKLKGTSSLAAIAIYGGTGYEQQEKAFAQGVEFVIATPGRLIDLYKNNIVDLKQVRAVVFDEADRMFDMGFKDDMRYLLSRISEERQFFVFSATLNSEVINVGYFNNANPVTCDVSRDQTKAENVKDQILQLGEKEKPQFLLSLLKREKPKQTIVFSNYKTDVRLITEFLNSNGYPSVGISSLLTQQQRTRALAQFKSDSPHNIMVATDVAARGLDIKGVDLVVNYQLPEDAENYVHRIGRTGRAGAEGKAFSLVSDRDVESLMRIEEFLKHKVEMGWMEDADIVKEMNPFLSERDLERKKSPPQERRPRPSYSKERGPRGERTERGERGTPERGPRQNSRQDNRSEARRSERGNGPQKSSHHKKTHGPQGSNGRPQNSASKNNRPRPQKSYSKSSRSIVAKPSLGKKITTFFKKLFT